MGFHKECCNVFRRVLYEKRASRVFEGHCVALNPKPSGLRDRGRPGVWNIGLVGRPGVGEPLQGSL